MPKHVVEAQGETYYLGRNPSHFDIRNLDFRIRDLTDMKPPRDFAFDTPGPILNQGSTPSCTGHGSRGWELCLPVSDPVAADETQIPDPRAVQIWQQAQIEEFGHTDPNDGATIHGIAKVLSDPSNSVLAPDGHSRMGTYVWAYDLEEILSFVTNEGPMIIGVTWYNSMFHTDSEGIMTIDPQSGVAGGHCVYIRGALPSKGLIGPIPNSWGTGYAKNGEFYIPVEQFKLLLPGGEFCAGLENPL